MSPAPSNSTPELHLANQMQKLKELSGAPVFVQKAVGYMDSICEASAQVHAGILKLVDSPVRFPSDFHNRAALPNEVFHSLSLQWALSRDSLFDIFEKERAAGFINSKEEMMMQAIFDNQIHIMELDAPADPIRQLCEAVEGFISYFQQAETHLQTRVGAHDAVLSNCSDKQALVSSIGIVHKKLRELQIDYEKIGMQIRKDYQV